MRLSRNKHGFTADLYKQSKAIHMSSDDVLKLIVAYKKTKNETKRDVLRDQIITTHVKFVLQLAYKASKISHVPVNDLFQNGIMGLLIALDKFDVKKKLKFSTYAHPWVRKHIQLSMADDMDIRIIPQLKTNCRRYMEIKGLEDDASEVRTKVKDKKLGSVSSMEMASRIFFDREAFVSLQSPVGDDNSTTLESILADGRITGSEGDNKILLEQVRSAVMRLRGKERVIILEKYFGGSGENVPRHDISRKINISNEGVRQIEMRAIQNLRKMLTIR